MGNYHVRFGERKMAPLPNREQEQACPKNGLPELLRDHQSTLPQFTILNPIQKVFPYQLLLPIPQLKHLKENLVCFWSVMEAIVPIVVE
uniref:NADH dehydrogenase subunit 7 n=1 Tax=Picea glauca TaxID=3330 RepID=A0A101LWP8_PICGL|nr:NADH dehydrogenase subunit 7 [Picea glauca]